MADFSLLKFSKSELFFFLFLYFVFKTSNKILKNNVNMKAWDSAPAKQGCHFCNVWTVTYWEQPRIFCSILHYSNVVSESKWMSLRLLMGVGPRWVVEVLSVLIIAQRTLKLYFSFKIKVTYLKTCLKGAHFSFILQFKIFLFGLIGWHPLISAIDIIETFHFFTSAL